MDWTDDTLPLSALQHLLFCARQCALIHIEQQWAENLLTAEGRLLHEKADSGRHESAVGVRIVRSLPVTIRRLGLSGIADVVEFRNDGSPPYPVEYKRGKPKHHDADRVQLCAQALCLEEMLGVTVPAGALFYGETRRREKVEFDAALRELTERLAAELWAMVRSGVTPAPVFSAKCRKCSLIEVCQPRVLCERGSAALFLRRSVQGALREDALKEVDD